MNTILNVTVTLPRTQNNQLDTAHMTVETESTETADYCMFLSPLVGILNDIRLSETGFKGA